MQTPERDTGGWPLLFGLMAVSAAAHLGVVVAMPHERPAARKNTTVEMAFYEPPPPPPPKVEEPEPPKELEKPKPKPVVKVETPKPPEDVPPPPNQEPPPTQTPTKVIPIPGLNFESTTVGGSFAAPVGNTTYGKADKVVNPADVKPYSAPKYAPPGSADSEPELMGEVKIQYPDEARKNDIEGSVRLKVTLNAEGIVENVVVISGPGYGLNEAARDALRRFRFKPATKAGEAIGYTFIYTYTFLLD